MGRGRDRDGRANALGIFLVGLGLSALVNVMTSWLGPETPAGFRWAVTAALVVLSVIGSALTWRASGSRPRPERGPQPKRGSGAKAVPGVTAGDVHGPVIGHISGGQVDIRTTEAREPSE